MTKYLKIVPIIVILLSWVDTQAQFVMGSITTNQQAVISTNTSVAIPTGARVSLSEGSLLNINTEDNVGIANLLGQTIIIPNIKLEGSGTKNFVGVTAATGSISINSGPVLIASSDSEQNSLVVGKDATIATSNGAYVQGFLVHQGLGFKDYPLGFEGTQGTARLSITEGDDDLTLTGMAFLPQSGDFTIPSPEGNITAISNNWLWVLGGENINVAEATLLIPVEDENIISSLDVKGIIVQSEIDGSSLTSLGGVRDGSSITSQQPTVGPLLRLGAEQIVELLIHNIITPNGDGENDILTIENIEQIDGVKKVTFLDRWGTDTKLGISNFQSDDPNLIPFFESFQSGNYICILELEDGRTIKQPITILKN
ncbi:MAG: gliding motility-associated C-terminal domain-containing protein [Bacteroidota bacterium]